LIAGRRTLPAARNGIMGVSTLGKTFTLVEDFERRRAAYYADFGERAVDAGAQLLARYLRNRMPCTKDALSCYDPDEVEVILATPILEEPVTIDFDEYFAHRPLSSDTVAEVLLDRAIEFAQVLVDTFRHLREQHVNEKAVGFARVLHTMAVRDIKELKKMKALNYF
jgi:hypothetical protein